MFAVDTGGSWGSVIRGIVSVGFCNLKSRAVNHHLTVITVVRKLFRSLDFFFKCCVDIGIWGGRNGTVKGALASSWSYWERPANTCSCSTGCCCAASVKPRRVLVPEPLRLPAEPLHLSLHGDGRVFPSCEVLQLIPLGCPWGPWLPNSSGEWHELCRSM